MTGTMHTVDLAAARDTRRIKIVPEAPW